MQEQTVKSEEGEEAGPREECGSIRAAAGLKGEAGGVLHGDQAGKPVSPEGRTRGRAGGQSKEARSNNDEEKRGEDHEHILRDCLAWLVRHAVYQTKTTINARLPAQEPQK